MRKNFFSVLIIFGIVFFLGKNVLADNYKSLIVKLKATSSTIIYNDLGYTPTITENGTGSYGINYNNALITDQNKKFFIFNCSGGEGQAIGRVPILEDNLNSDGSFDYQLNNVWFGCGDTGNSLNDYQTPPDNNQYDYFEFRYYATATTPTTTTATGTFSDLIETIGIIGTSTLLSTSTGITSFSYLITIPFFDYFLVLSVLCFTVLMVWFAFYLLYPRKKQNVKVNNDIKISKKDLWN